MKILLGILKGIYAVSHTIILLFGMFFMFLVTTAGLARFSFGIISGNRLYDLSKLTIGDTPYLFLFLLFIFSIGTVINVIRSFKKSVDKTKEGKANGDYKGVAKGIINWLKDN